ncbi:uncharacterized protein LOC126738957 isoform X3 [Anthonomus grandis grandis]|uniref:uncharacterized protein LOC126738957 isoform X3 n=1 Tax=Anthonomus grandis grandis TaxID=2921223 RepID=UPI002165F195|nr:uncharacterized protein LOC126738957 isoform X3 [Anthonomus grandis grandis]
MASHGQYCCVESCKKHSNDPSVSFFCIPNDDVRCQQWKENLGFVGEHKYAKLTPKEAHKLRICSLHFSSSSLIHYTGRRLKNTAIPSRIPPEPEDANVTKDAIEGRKILVSQETQTDPEMFNEEKQTKQEDSEENTFQEQSDFRGECSSKAKLTTSDSFDQASEDSNFEPDETKVIIKEEPLDSDLDEIECKKIKIECESEEDCDEDLLFFKSLLPDFKLLSPEIKRELQGRIQEMVREATLSTTMHNF